MARDTGQTLHTVMGWSGPLTHLQFRVWQLWQELDLSRPGKTEWYLLRVAQRAMQSWVAEPNGIELEHQLIDFSFLKEGQEQEPMTEQEEIEQASTTARAAWGARLGGALTARITKQEADEIDKLPPADAARERRRRAMEKSS